jgi:hypothetical protein
MAEAAQPLADLALQASTDEFEPTLEQTAQTIATNLTAFVRAGDDLTFPLLQHPHNLQLEELLRTKLNSHFMVFPMPNPDCISIGSNLIIAVRYIG